jgi:ComF family protein
VLVDFANDAVRLLLAPHCAVCRTWLDRPLAGPVCTHCWRSVQRLAPPWCVVCGDALARNAAAVAECPRCRRQPPRFALARSAGVYDGTLREIVHALKYGGLRALARPLGALMREAGGTLLEDADAVVPVPLDPWRRLGRGFNQADDLACELGLPVLRVLRRRRHGRPQSGLPASRRRANVRGSFAIRRGPSGLGWAGGPAFARGSVFVLVDDVMTTGATLDDCSRALIEAGAGAVRALTAARAVAARPLPPQPSPGPWAPRRR